MERKYLSDINSAEDFLNVAENSSNNSLKTFANMMYFALERAIVAFLHFKGKKVPKNRQKLWELASELLGENCYLTLRQLYDLRLQADYGAINQAVSLDSRVLKLLFIKTKEIIFHIKKTILIEKDGKHSTKKGEHTKKVL